MEMGLVELKYHVIIIDRSIYRGVNRGTSSIGKPRAFQLLLHWHVCEYLCISIKDCCENVINMRKVK